MEHSPQSIGFDAAEFGSREVGPAERRNGSRLRTVYRVARVLTSGDQGFAKVLNLSDEGMMLSLALDTCLGDTIAIDLSETCSLHGIVLWRQGRRCGVRLTMPIDSAQTLKRLFDERCDRWTRPLRLPLEKPVLVTCEQGLQVVRLRDVSQGGMKVAHDGRLVPGLAIRVQLAAGLRRRGVVRWSRDGVAGVLLTEILTVDDLGSLEAL